MSATWTDAPPPSHLVQPLFCLPFLPLPSFLFLSPLLSLPPSSSPPLASLLFFLSRPPLPSSRHAATSTVFSLSRLGVGVSFQRDPGERPGWNGDEVRDYSCRKRRLRPDLPSSTPLMPALSRRPHFLREGAESTSHNAGRCQKGGRGGGLSLHNERDSIFSPSRRAVYCFPTRF